MYIISFVNIPQIWVAPRLKQQQSNPHPSPIDNRMAELSASNLAMKEKMLT